MDKLKIFSIPFVGLKQGIHRFNYEISNDFWTNYEYAEISKSTVSVDLIFDKKNSFFTLHFTINGTINVQCDRCSDFFDLPIFSENRIVVKMADGMKKSDNEDADMIFISKADTEFNVAQVIYELINLSLPMYKVHPENENGESTCNKKMLNEIKKHSPRESKEIDPRWEALKKISPN